MTDEVDLSKISKPCPKCGGTLIVRQNRANGSRFLGCKNWPVDCGHTEQIPDYAKMLASGMPVLPGFE